MSRALPIAYTINHEHGLRLDIALVEAEKLLLHEETIPEMLQTLTLRIREDGKLKAPVIVDRETLVVLDGMHRVEALRRLGCRFVCICLVDYDSPEIKVDRWCRTISDHLDEGDAAGLVRKLGFRPSMTVPGRTSGRNTSSKVMFKDSSYELNTSRSDIMTSFDVVRELEARFKDLGLDIRYETEQYATEQLLTGAVDAVICPPKISKRQVVESAKQGRVFIFKSTRHVIPARPLGVDVPLSLLQDRNISVEEANERLSEMLRRRRLRHVLAGSTWNGRRYDEDLYVFDE